MNKEDYVDLILKNVDIDDGNKIFEDQLLAIRFEESLLDEKIVFTPICIDYGKSLKYIGHKVMSISDTNLCKIFKYKYGKIIKIN